MELRQRFAKSVALERERYLLLVAQAQRGALEAWTLLQTRDARYLSQQRVGRLIYARDDEAGV